MSTVLSRAILEFISGWAKYNYVLSAALDSGDSHDRTIQYNYTFLPPFPLNETIGANTIQSVYKRTLDHDAVPVLDCSTLGLQPSTW
ncbi:hypothetical protein BU15DRAFT_46997 [Melanogaster broomeanus]|nr:hypothetical protein BU15DRAFT_46997 [Melanogaster broomeanus]